MVMQRLIVIVLATVAVAAPAPCFAQSERGSITGVVVDTTKAAIPGVSVKVINTATNAASNVVSSESGTYSATNLPPETYRLEASLQQRERQDDPSRRRRSILWPRHCRVFGLGQPGATPSSSNGLDFSNSQTFGVISTQADSPRRLQLGLKLYF